MPDSYFDTHYQTCYLRSTGDYWHNRQEVAEFLETVTDQKQTLLHFDYQGFSMQSSGLLDLIRHHAKNKPFLKPNSMLVIHSPNRCEDNLGYYNLFDMPVCDEFLRCQNYWIDNVPAVDTGGKRFAHMIGRPTLPRVKLFWDTRQLGFEDHFFESKLQETGPGIWNFPEYHYDQLEDWFADNAESKAFSEWFRTAPMQSFDQCSLADQAKPGQGVRLSAVQQCTKYYVDIVFESLTVGDTFAPTEKLIRSLITKKPFIVFAAPGYLQKLKHIGFRTFDQFWDESYDQYQLQARYQRILDVIVGLVRLSDNDFIDLVQQTQDIAEHNKNLLKKLNIEYHGSLDQWINKVEPVS